LVSVLEAGQSITIRKNERSILPGIAGAILGCVCLALAFLNAEFVRSALYLHFTRPISAFDVTLYRVFLLIVATFFFCMVAFVGIRRRTSKAYLVMDESGVVEYSDALVSGFIPWCDVEETGVQLVGNRMIIAIRLTHTAMYTDKRSHLNKGMMKITMQKDHQIVLIDLSDTYWHDTGRIEAVYQIDCDTEYLQ